MYNDTIFSQSRDALYGLIADTIDFGIVVGKNQSLDSLAAALSIYLSLQAAGKSIQIISQEEPIVEHSNLVAVDKIQKSFSGRTKMVVLSIPFKEGEVEKVSFNTEADRMNFNITASEAGISPFDLNDIQIVRRGVTPQVIFAIGVEDPAELQGLVEVTPETKLINIDRSTANTLFGTVVLVDPAFSSLSEVIVRLIQELALPSDVDIAQNLMDGISSETQNFSSSKTSLYAFEAAAFLLREGAVRRGTQEAPKQGAFQQSQASPFARIQKQVQQRAQMTQPQPTQVPQPSVPPVQEPVMPIQQQPTQDVQPQPVSSNGQATQNQPDQEFDESEVPSDWFVPKVFKGSKKPAE